MLASAAAVLSIVAFAVVAFVGPGGGVGAAFNACISQPRFLVLVRYGPGNSGIEMIKDRAHGAVVGEFALLPSERAAEALTTTLAGLGARSDRYVVLTRVPPLDPDATAIERCWDRTVVSAP
jgi:hypothetical protein